MHTLPGDVEALTVRPLLAVDGVTAGYGGRPVISEVSVSVESGEIVAVLGANGAGKSTLLKTVVGLLRADGGRVELDGQEITRLSTEARTRLGLGYVPQVDAVFDDLSVYENLMMGGHLLARKQARDRVSEVLEMFPTLHRMAVKKRMARGLSAGERRMLAMARVLMLNPKVLVLDEPTTGLTEEVGHRLLRDQLGLLAAQGRGIMVVEQRAIAALEASARAYIVVSGKVTMSASCEDLLRQGNIGAALLGMPA